MCIHLYTMNPVFPNTSPRSHVYICVYACTDICMYVYKEIDTCMYNEHLKELHIYIYVYLFLDNEHIRE